MTAMVARLVLAMLLLPMTGAVFVVTMTTMIRPAGPPDTSQLLTLWGIVYLFVGLYWVLLWAGVVHWTTRRIVLTAAATVVSLALGAVVGLVAIIMNHVLPGPLALMAGGGIVPIVWVLATVLVWKETPAERVQRLAGIGAPAVTCPLCGYNLAGLHEARCPECGGQFTLDQLVSTSTKNDPEGSDG